MAAVTAPLLEPVPAHRPSTVSVVVVAETLGQWDDVDRAIDSLRRQSRCPEQVVLVVDHHDQLLEWAADVWSTADGHVGLRVDVVANTGHRGPTGARNTGASWSFGDVIAFLDHGSETADRRWVETMLQDYADADVAAVGGGAPGAEVDAVTDANMSFRREVLDAIGGFAPGVGSVDDVCVRIRRRFPLARLLHELTEPSRVRS